MPKKKLTRGEKAARSERTVSRPGSTVAKRAAAQNKRKKAKKK